MLADIAICAKRNNIETQQNGSINILIELLNQLVTKLKKPKKKTSQDHIVKVSCVLINTF
jgi:hypothetical protein